MDTPNGFTPEQEQFIRREVARQVASAPRSAEYRADEYDFKVERIEVYAGPGWILHSILGPDQGAAVYAVWYMRRVDQAALRIAPHVNMTPTR